MLANKNRKIAKACNACQSRKIRCNGELPCQRCEDDPGKCTYRLKARIRKSSRRVSEAAGSGDATQDAESDPSPSSRNLIHSDPPAHDAEKSARSELYDSITATHHAPRSTDSPQLFYGPSSNFAFLRQVYKGVLSSASARSVAENEPQEGGPGLDMFLQRSIFFGPPLRVNMAPCPDASSRRQAIPSAQAREFLEQFKAASLYRLPFFTVMELDSLLLQYYDHSQDSAISPQSRALLLAILALGALSTERTDLAELLFTQAKQEAVLYDDTVSIQMIQFSITVADYQLNMARANSAYLHLGIACRKAFALGLHKEPLASLDEDASERHRTTIWCLYFHETWQTVTMGRQSALKMSDISCHMPRNESWMAIICELASIVEKGVEAIYGRRAGSLRQLYQAAEKVRAQLRDFAEQHHIASESAISEVTRFTAVELLTLHDVYYQAILLTFRPFLVADTALRASGNSHGNEEMWLRQACRYAVDAAQDSIVFVSNLLRRESTCRTLRYQGFFFECSCAVLLHDTLHHPSKRAYNHEYLSLALESLGTMINDEPLTIAKASIEQIVKAVERAISQGHDGILSLTRPGDSGTALSKPLTAMMGDRAQAERQPHILQGEQRGGIDRSIQQSSNSSEPVDLHWGFPPHPGPEGVADWNPFASLNYDVRTTNLSDFFPIDITTPDDFSLSGLMSGLVPQPNTEA